MRKLLVTTGLCLTAGTFVAAERLTSASERTVALEQQTTIEAALKEHMKQSDAKFADEIAALTDGKTAAEAQVAALTGTVEDLSSAKEDLMTQVAVARSAADAIRETIGELEAKNLDLAEEIAARDASLEAKDAELGALTAQIETLGQDGSGAPENSPESAELIAEIAALNMKLASRDEAISELQERIDAWDDTATAAPVAEGDDATAALAEELELARATIDELNSAATDSAARLSEITETLRDREATVAQLQAELEEKAEAIETASVASETDGDPSEELQSLSARLAELTELVDSQTETISHLRMGFDQKPASPMEMASACIDRANKIFEISQIKFGTGTSSISEQSTATLDHLRDLAIGCESDEMFIEIGGHTDSQGAEAANQRLSEARANSVRDFLIGRGIPADTMIAVGYGESQPIATNDTPVGRAQNRRITFTWQMREDDTAEEETTYNVDG